MKIKFQDVKRLMNEAFDNISVEDWKNAVQHAISEEEHSWKVDNILEEMEPIIINLNDESDSDDE